MTAWTISDIRRLDATDPLANRRALFSLPDDLIYLDGNSLGAQPLNVPSAVATITTEWREELIGGWRDFGWFDLPDTVANQISKIIGAETGEVVVCDTVTTNLFKALSAAIQLRPDRAVVLAEEAAFPTDVYVARSVANLFGKELRLVPIGADVADHLDESVGVALLSHVDFRTAQRLDLPSVTSQVHAVGSLALWDLSHSAGVMPVGLGDSGVDFAVGCTYKYLNGGPGAPAYVFASKEHLDSTLQPIHGWMGHSEPFLMTDEYEPAPGARRFVTGTQPIISMRVLGAALDAYDGVDLVAVREKSKSLTGLFIDLVDQQCAGLGVTLLSPRDSALRGSQVSLHHPEAVPIYERLVEAGVRGDYRTPDILRFGFAPLYVSHMDVWNAVARVRSVLAHWNS